MRAGGGHEPGGCGVENELEHLPGLVAHLQAPPILVHRQHGAMLEAAAEVRDPRWRADARQWS
jgi:hypothetical protein